jgi:hypothetical protein
MFKAMVSLMTAFTSAWAADRYAGMAEFYAASGRRSKAVSCRRQAAVRRARCDSAMSAALDGSPEFAQAVTRSLRQRAMREVSTQGDGHAKVHG